MPPFELPLRRSVLALLLLSLAVLIEFATSTAAALPPANTLPVLQSATLVVLPPIAQPGPDPASPAMALTVLTASVVPAIKGRQVRLEVRGERHQWSVVATARLGRVGRAVFTARTRIGGQAPSYRVRATGTGELPAVLSRSVRANVWGTPSFADRFDGEAIGPAWEHRIQFPNPWGGRACSKGDPAAVAAGGGTLQLSVLPDPERAGELCPTWDPAGAPAGSYAYRLNGHISTQSTFDYQYGVAAARIKFQREPGQHGAFWLQPRGLLEHEPTRWGAEIDVIESYGSEGDHDMLSSFVHHRRPDDTTDELLSVGGPISGTDRFLSGVDDNWWSGYHVFSVEWTPEEYVFYIDGRRSMRTREGVSHHPEFLILSMLSSDWELGDLGSDEHLPQRMDVDWVQVWPAH